VTATLPGADVRGFYQSLGIELPGWAQHEDWGCGAKGGAYDAALARGLDSRQAFELKVAYGHLCTASPIPTRNAHGDRDPSYSVNIAWPNATRSALTPVGVSRSLAALARGLPASWRRPLGRVWRWMSGSLGRRALGLRVCCGHRACCVPSTGVCGRARRCWSWAVAGRAAAC
jgi:hypothetical protein